MEKILPQKYILKHILLRTIIVLGSIQLIMDYIDHEKDIHIDVL